MGLLDVLGLQPPCERVSLHRTSGALNKFDVGREVTLAAETALRDTKGEKRNVRPGAMAEALQVGAGGIDIARRLVEDYVEHLAKRHGDGDDVRDRLDAARLALKKAKNAKALDGVITALHAAPPDQPDAPELESFGAFLDRHLRGLDEQSAEALLRLSKLKPKRMSPPRGKAIRTPKPAGSPDVSVFDAAMRDDMVSELRSRADEMLKSKDPEVRAAGGRLHGAANKVEKARRPSWRQTEAEIQGIFKDLGDRAEVPFLHGTTVPMFTVGSTRPDVVVTGAMIEIKNYRLFDEKTRKVDTAGVGRLIAELRRQFAERVTQGDPTKRQRVILDVRGQKGKKKDLTAIAQRVVQELNDVIFEHLASEAARLGDVTAEEEIAANDTLKARMVRMSDVEILVWDEDVK